MERLDAVEAALWYAEDDDTPRNVGGVAILRPGDRGFDRADLVRLVSSRIGAVPRYRQRLREVPGRLSSPVWVDDVEFDIAHHVKEAALPMPGTRAQLEDLIARLMARPVDRSRPLWEMYFVSGFHDGSVAVVTKSHQVLVGGHHALDIAQILLDRDPCPEDKDPQAWSPRPDPSDRELIASALSSALSQPAAAMELAIGTAKDVASAVDNATGWVKDTGVGVIRSIAALTQIPIDTPLSARIGAQRRFVTAEVSLSAVRKVRRGGKGTVNDVLLAIVTGALRDWLLNRGRIVESTATVRALVPVSIHREGGTVDHEPTDEVLGFLVDLPVGEPDPLIRLHHISYRMKDLRSTGRFVGAAALTGIAGFGPSTLHALGARVGMTLSRRAYNLSVINVPGPQRPLFAAGSELIAAYPYSPLVHGQALGIGLTSYRGQVFIGLTADHDALSDVDNIVRGIERSLQDLSAAAKRNRFRVLKGRADTQSSPSSSGETLVG